MLQTLFLVDTGTLDTCCREPSSAPKITAWENPPPLSLPEADLLEALRSQAVPENQAVWTGLQALVGAAKTSPFIDPFSLHLLNRH